MKVKYETYEVHMKTYEKYEIKVCISLVIPLRRFLCSLNGSAHFFVTLHS